MLYEFSVKTIVEASEEFDALVKFAGLDYTIEVVEPSERGDEPFIHLTDANGRATSYRSVRDAHAGIVHDHKEAFATFVEKLVR